MADWPWMSTWEEFSGGSKAHGYGMFPGYFLSAYVLGVRPDGPAFEGRVVIEPHLGDLTSAAGAVVTARGPVNLSWRISSGSLSFDVKLPAGVTGKLRVPYMLPSDALVLDGKFDAGKLDGHYLTADLSPGAHHGACGHAIGLKGT
jgi:hypothetical protein